MGPNIPGTPEQRATIICIYITCEVFDSFFFIWLPFRAVGTVKRPALLNGLDFQRNTKQMFCGIFFLNENKKFKQIVVMAAAVREPQVLRRNIHTFDFNFSFFFIC